MKLELTTPALLFSTVSLLILAFNNRFISIAQLIRNLHDKYKNNNDDTLLPQIKKLRKRLSLIRDMQVVAISSLLMSVITMLLLFYDLKKIANVTFAISLLMLVTAMLLAVAELLISTNALRIMLQDAENSKERKYPRFKMPQFITRNIYEKESLN
jgi:hypothetical protein